MIGTSHVALRVCDGLQDRFRSVADVVLLRGGGSRLVFAVEYRGHQRTLTCASTHRDPEQMVDALTRDIVEWMAAIVKEQLANSQSRVAEKVT